MNYGRKTAIALTGLTPRRIDYWARTGIVRPAVPAAGKGSRREYSFRDLVALRVARKLTQEGIGLQKIRTALAWLRRHFPDLRQPLAELRFLTDGETVFVIERNPEVILDTLKSGQFMLSLALGQLIEGLQGDLKKLAASKEETVMAGGKSFAVVLTPDLVDGGFSAQCQEIPGAISQGETEQEALDNVVEVLEEHFAHLESREIGTAMA